MKKSFLFLFAFAVVLTGVSCLSPEENSERSSDGYSEEESDLCTDGVEALFDCGYPQSDGDGGYLTLFDAVALCEAGDAYQRCVAYCGKELGMNCDSYPDCFEHNLCDNFSPDDDGDNAGDKAPVLSDGHWEPDTFTWDSSVDCNTTPCTTLKWSVCDPDNNLEGGMVYVRTSGSTVVNEGAPWSELFPEGIPDVSDCDNPATVSIDVTLEAPLEAGDYYMAVDIEATDADGNISNKLTDIRVDFTYAP